MSIRSVTPNQLNFEWERFWNTQELVPALNQLKVTQVDPSKFRRSAGAVPKVDELLAHSTARAQEARIAVEGFKISGPTTQYYIQDTAGILRAEDVLRSCRRDEVTLYGRTLNWILSECGASSIAPSRASSPDRNVSNQDLIDLGRPWLPPHSRGPSPTSQIGDGAGPQREWETSLELWQQRGGEEWRVIRRETELQTQIDLLWTRNRQYERKRLEDEEEIRRLEARLRELRDHNRFLQSQQLRMGQQVRTLQEALREASRSQHTQREEENPRNHNLRDEQTPMAPLGGSVDMGDPYGQLDNSRPPRETATTAISVSMAQEPICPRLGAPPESSQETHGTTPAREEPRDTDVGRLAEALGLAIRAVGRDQGSGMPPPPQPTTKDDLSSLLRLRQMVRLTLNTKDIRQADGVGVKHFNDFVRQVETTCPHDAQRMALVPYTVEPELLERMKIHQEADRTKLTWAQFKELAMGVVPKSSESEVLSKLYQNTFTMQDDPVEYSIRMSKEYKTACQMLRVPQLEVSFNEVISETVVANMRPEGRPQFKKAFLRDVEEGVRKLEEALKDRGHRRELFLDAKPRPALGNTPRSLVNVPPTTSMATETRVPDQQPFPAPARGMGGQPGTGPQPNSPTHYGNSARRPPPPSGPYEQTKSAVAERRRATVQQWRRWICSSCRSINAGGFYTCGEGQCEGRATPNQIPSESWQCQNHTEQGVCGQNVWRSDHYCYQCQAVNPSIPDRLQRPLPVAITPISRDRQHWNNPQPALEP